MSPVRSPKVKPRLLLVDDDQAFAKALGLLLRDRFQVDEICDGKSAMGRFEAQEYDAILLDVDLQKQPDGLDVLRFVRSQDPDLPVFMVSRLDRPETVLAAGRLGATDFFAKGDAVELLAHRLDNALAGIVIKRKQEALSRETDRSRSDLVGDSEVIKRLRVEAKIVAQSLSTVLVTGDSGTGKEVLARLLHRQSPRSQGPFVAINCAAIPEGLVESELFGHQRGAFTGATEARRGSFELAQDGTLFLDEITEMPLALQPKLLRVLQSGEYSRLGSERLQRSDARVLCATNKDPAAAVQAGTLREDLYYRINVIHLSLPPLKERRDDIPLLARYFIRLKAEEQGKVQPTLSAAAEAILVGHDWPGNVRELENVIERAIVFCQSPELGPHLLRTIGEGADYVGLQWAEARELALKRFERSYLSLLLRIHRGSVTMTATAMGVSRQAVYDAVERTGVDLGAFRL